MQEIRNMHLASVTMLLRTLCALAEKSNVEFNIDTEGPINDLKEAMHLAGKTSKC